MNKCIVNYITRNTWHPFGQSRLAQSLDLAGFEGDLLLLDDENFKCPSHKKSPYAFKLYALKEAERLGYKQILWVDASFWAIKRLELLFETITEKNVVVQNSGFPLGQWASDDCLKRMDVDREIAFGLPLFSGGLLGLNLENKRAETFFNKFYEYAQQGTCFKGAWRNRNNEVSNDKRVSGHRHDMTVGSILMDRMKLPIYPNNSFFAYYGWYEQYKTEMDLSKISFVCEGGPRKLNNMKRL